MAPPRCPLAGPGGSLLTSPTRLPQPIRRRPWPCAVVVPLGRVGVRRVPGSQSNRVWQGAEQTTRETRLGTCPAPGRGTNKKVTTRRKTGKIGSNGYHTEQGWPGNQTKIELEIHKRKHSIAESFKVSLKRGSVFRSRPPGSRLHPGPDIVDTRSPAAPAAPTAR